MDKKVFSERDLSFIKGDWENSKEEVEKMKVVIELKKLKILEEQLEIQKATLKLLETKKI
jgi:hypothetical protein